MTPFPSAGSVECTPLGQAGFRLRYGSTSLYVDPYLSHSVEEQEGPQQRRLVDIWREPSSIVDADVVLVTHAHLDHCDPATLLPIANASPRCRFVAPGEARDRMVSFGIAADRIQAALSGWLDLADGIRIHATPAAHPTVERDSRGGWHCVGYVMEFGGRRIYHAGDTFVMKDVIESVVALGPIDVAMLPVNEHNYFRESLGIVGNMGLRDAFHLAAMLEARALVPMHWDMFGVNRVHREEIELYARLEKPAFEVLINPNRL